MKVAVITPYYQEELATLRRCHDSVLRQTHDCTHFFVADGHARDELDGWDAQHIRLPVAHRDFGNTPRGLGGISALNQGFDAVAFLDADNWYADEHVESLVSFCLEHDLPVAFSARHIVLPTGEICPFVDESDANRTHVDTSCFFFTKRSAFIVPMWAMMHRNFASICDRFIFQAIHNRGLSYGWTGRQTVYYETRWAVHYQRMGLEPPPDAHQVDWSELSQPYVRERMIERLGFDPYPQATRAALDKQP